jgi:hypothetical protein
MATTAKYTPTPWQQYSEWQQLRIVGNLDGPDDGKMHYTTICEVELTADDTCLANAAHIVKCVNCHDKLVEALKVAKNWMDYYQPEKEDENDKLARNIVRAAIARATGEQP